MILSFLFILFLMFYHVLCFFLLYSFLSHFLMGKIDHCDGLSVGDINHLMFMCAIWVWFVIFLLLLLKPRMLVVAIIIIPIYPAGGMNDHRLSVHALLIKRDKEVSASEIFNSRKTCKWKPWMLVLISNTCSVVNQFCDWSVVK